MVTPNSKMVPTPSSLTASSSMTGRSLPHHAPARCSLPRIRQPPYPMAQAGAAATPGRKVVVVGGGVGGLALAGQLARAGLNVTLLEQNEQVGGRAQSESTPAGFRFDTGPSLLLFPDKYRDAFSLLGREAEDLFHMRRVGGQGRAAAGYRVFFADDAAQGGAQGGTAPGRTTTPGGTGTSGAGGSGGVDGSAGDGVGGVGSVGLRVTSSLDMLYDEDEMAAQLEAVETGAGAAYRRWLAAAGTALRSGMELFIDKNIDSLSSMVDLPRLMPLLGQVDLRDMIGNHHSRMCSYFQDPRLRALFSFQDLYVGLSPYQAPAAFSLLAATELLDGVWYPIGGFGRVVAGLQEAAHGCGASIQTNARVGSIDLEPGGVAVRGVTLESGERLDADIVVANRDLPLAYDLIPDSEYAQRRSRDLYKKQYSAGVIGYCWSVEGRFDRLLHHNVFLSDQYAASWQRATRGSELQASPNFYVHVPNRTDPSAAPEGCDSIMVLLPVANMQQMESAGRNKVAGYAELMEEGRRRVLATMQQAGVGDVGACIREETVRAPPEWAAEYGLQHGAAFGLSHGLNQLAALRPDNKDPKIDGLYFVGASTRPGNGVPLALIGAKLTAERILGRS